MLKIGDKTFLNLQEAVAWLMENNCIPFQCTAPYAANTEIGMGTIVNPSPAKVRIGSIIFFSDSKVSTVTGITQNGFMVSDKYNDLVDDVVYVKNVAIAGNGHLMVTLSNDDVIDAGLIKQVSGFSIDGLQHLVVSYNDGTTQDLGAIFNGNVNIAGNFTADSIIENMVGYSYNGASLDSRATLTYVGAVKTGNKVTFVIAGSLELPASIGVGNYINLGIINIPSEVGSHIIPNISPDNRVGPAPVLLIKDVQNVYMHSGFIAKYADSLLDFMLNPMGEIAAGTYSFRYETTFLLGDNLAA